MVQLKAPRDINGIKTLLNDHLLIAEAEEDLIEDVNLKINLNFFFIWPPTHNDENICIVCEQGKFYLFLI